MTKITDIKFETPSLLNILNAVKDERDDNIRKVEAYKAIRRELMDMLRHNFNTDDLGTVVYELQRP